MNDSRKEINQKPVNGKENTIYNKKKAIVFGGIAAVLVCAIGFLVVSGIGGHIYTKMTAGTSLESTESKAMESAYQSGLDLMEKEAYEEAIEAFASISRQHYRYTDAQSHIDMCADYYSQQLTASLSSYYKEQKYEEAYTELKEVNDKLLSDYLDFQNQYSELSEKYQKYLFSKVEEYKDDDDYADAFDLLNHCDRKILKDDKVIDEKIAALQSDYQVLVLSEAEEIAENVGRESAVMYLQEASTVLPGDKEIENKIEEYLASQPVDLYELDYFNAGALDSKWQDEPNYSSAHFVRSGDTLIDNIGNEYPYSLKTPGTAFGCWETYKLNGAYKTLSGRIVVDEEYKTSSHVGELRIYGDGIELYRSPKVTKGSDPVDFSISVAGVEELTIQMMQSVQSWYGTSHFALVNTKLNK